uniref:Zinc metalloprotease n=1 Tax=Candidatus Kentrum sp. TUN TaxID=2126343 RepID=A0A450ZSH9_9GAMM|nr:MAG: regulator of sigma E protease [Candidatus Kentron sp. TUN]VFK65653.1 MAG: regulator of sigma E protease [Candidatus Kentron sp. TUN]
MDLFYAVLGFVITIGILVTVHEFGHFWVAQRLGVKVLRFSVGFGQPLWMRRFGPDNTEYTIAMIPLGGYVKMLDEREGEVAKNELPRAFNRQSLPVRLAIVFAGPLCNILFAVFVYWAMFIIGVNGIKPFVMDVAPESIAAQAGLLPNDTILSVDDQGTRSWESVMQTVVAKMLTEDAVPVVIQRESEFNIQLTLDLSSISLDDFSKNGFFYTVGISPPSPHRTTMIGQVKPGGAAKRAGLKKGDRVISAEGEVLSDWNAWRKFIRRHPGQTIEIQIERNGLPMTIHIRPDPVKTEAGTIGFIGAVADHPTEQSLKDYQHEFYITERYSPIAAFGHALAKTGDSSLLTVRTLWKILTFQVSVKNLSGPISIAQYAGIAVQTGFSRFLQLLGILSISIGILNLLPIPVLDGGHIMYYCIEFVKRRPLSEKAQSIGQQIGITMLVGLMGLALFNDFARLFGV